MKSRRERAKLLTGCRQAQPLEPWLVQKDLLQLLVVEVGHPDGLGQPCILTPTPGPGRGGVVNNYMQ